MKEINKDLIEKYIFFSGWKEPCDQSCKILHAQIYFKAECPDKKEYDFQSISNSVINDNEIPKDLILFERMKEIKKEIAILILKEYIWESLSNDCLVHPKMIPYFEDELQIITEEQAKKHNDYWMTIAKEILPDGNFLVLVRNIKVFNPKTNEFENFGIIE